MHPSGFSNCVFGGGCQKYDKPWDMIVDAIACKLCVISHSDIVFYRNINPNHGLWCSVTEWVHKQQSDWKKNLPWSCVCIADILFLFMWSGRKVSNVDCESLQYHMYPHLLGSTAEPHKYFVKIEINSDRHLVEGSAITKSHWVWGGDRGGGTEREIKAMGKCFSRLRILVETIGEIKNPQIKNLSPDRKAILAEPVEEVFP